MCFLTWYYGQIASVLHVYKEDKHRQKTQVSISYRKTLTKIERCLTNLIHYKFKKKTEKNGMDLKHLKR